MEQLKITYLPLSALKARKNNPRSHPKGQIQQLAQSMKDYGFPSPILIAGDGTIVAGHARSEAAALAGLTEVPTICVDYLTSNQIRAYVIADNKIAENAGWDRKLLEIEIEELRVAGIDGLSLGFSEAELDAFAASRRGPGAQKGDNVPAIDAAIPAVSRPGDMWLIGSHRLLCGDATKPDDLQKLLGGTKADLVITDAPYNVPIQGHVSGLGKVQHREFANASGEMSKAEFTQFLEKVFTNLAAFSTDGSIHYYFMDWRHMDEVLAAATGAKLELKNLCVWVKSNGGMGSLYRSRHELVFVYKNGPAPHINNVSLGKNGRNRTNVWEYAGANSFGKDRDAELAMHPTVKPVALIADAILDCSTKSSLILDVFAGSGTTLVAAQSVGRAALGLEIDPLYVDTAVRRVASVMPAKAILEGTNLSFEEVAAQRASEGARNG